LFDISLSKASKQIELLHERRTALISAAVTGKIDVRDWQPPSDAAIAA
jgi:type I restriction enzyme S subunit